MAQIALSDLTERYGQNTYQWADVNGIWDNTTATLTGAVLAALMVNINASINSADARIDDLLRGTSLNFIFPVVDLTGAVPLTIKDCKRKLAGYMLSTARDVRDFDANGKPITNLYSDYVDAMQIVEDIRSKKIILNCQY